MSVDFNLYLAMNILLISCLVMSQLTDTKVLQSNRFDRLAETNDTDEIKEINCKKKKERKEFKTLTSAIKSYVHLHKVSVREGWRS